MARRIEVKVEGVATTVAAISIFNMELRQDLIKLVRETAKTIQKDARARAPVSKTPKSRGQPGDLRRSIRPKYFDGGLSATVVPRKPKGSHRHLVEYGTGPRSTRRGANRGRMPKKPFMGPAEKANETTYNSKVRKLVDRDEVI